MKPEQGGMGLHSGMYGFTFEQKGLMAGPRHSRVEYQATRLVPNESWEDISSGLVRNCDRRALRLDQH
jgi:hypothetical protein